MDKQLLNFLKRVTLEDAQLAFRNAEAESVRDCISLTKSDAYQIWLDTCEMIRGAIRADAEWAEPKPLRMTAAEHLAYNKRQPKPLFGIDVLRFVFAARERQGRLNVVG